MFIIKAGTKILGRFEIRFTADKVAEYQAIVLQRPVLVYRATLQGIIKTLLCVKLPRDTVLKNYIKPLDNSEVL